MESLHNTSDSLIGRIEADARAEADAILAKAAQSVAALEAENAARLDTLRRDAQKRRDAEVRAVLDGIRTRAELDGRKTTLAGKRALMDEVYADAYAGLCAMAGEKRERLIRALIVREAVDGDTVAPAAVDRKLVADMLDALPVRVKLSPDDAPAENGFLLLGQGYEKDCSFKAVMAETWAAAETETASLLFS